MVAPITIMNKPLGEWVYDKIMRAYRHSEIGRHIPEDTFEDWAAGGSPYIADAKIVGCTYTAGMGLTLGQSPRLRSNCRNCGAPHEPVCSYCLTPS
jgi:hypothetical protein